MSKLFVKQKHLDILKDIFKSYCPNAIIRAYGSRLNGNCHDGSDLDLVVKDFGDKNCDIIELKTLISNSNIPFLVDILEFDLIPESFQKEILKNYVVIFGQGSD